MRLEESIDLLLLTDGKAWHSNEFFMGNLRIVNCMIRGIQYNPGLIPSIEVINKNIGICNKRGWKGHSFILFSEVLEKIIGAPRILIPLLIDIIQ